MHQASYFFLYVPHSRSILCYVTGKNETGAAPEDVSEEMGELLGEITNISDENVLPLPLITMQNLKTFILSQTETAEPDVSP